MAKKTPNVIQVAYRATLEEQDDTVVWLTRAMRAAGASLDVLLRGNAVNYAVAGQDAAGLAFGDRRQTRPPRLDRDVAKLVEEGARVLAVAEDLAERGVEAADLVAGVERIGRDGLPELFSAYDQVWHW
jgi:sulfur relay (sulfurtransferase) DsrF/TusC family protein